ncbi:MAG: neutral/alkaline non-lysosomal ceramidase N-terminal domain-containing protein [Opitutales bacterium]|nr:neutral/alkaline non-lysosomal ceramidase N-terminal domain-containing protein [Opitutales bacterium]
MLPVSVAPHLEASWQAGVASAVITPERFIWMGGYAARDRPAEGTGLDLFAKALALEDEEGSRVVVVSMEVIGVSKGMRLRIAAEVERLYGLGPEALLLNASHTHSGPEIYRLADTPDEAALEDPKTRDAWQFTSGLEKRVVALVGEAIAELAPARLTWNEARCGFAMNRRRDYSLPDGHPNATRGPNPAGPVDHAVPALRVEAEDGRLRAVLFGYACHNTSLSGYEWSGDYAGYAQAFLQAERPGFKAIFLTGCAGDQNPYPRRSGVVPGVSELELAQQHGRTLANAVEVAISANPIPVTGPLGLAYGEVSLDFEDPERPAHDYPVQVLRFGESLVLVALGAEVVVDYSLRLKRELGELASGAGIWVAAYSNDYTGYIPSVRIQNEGGYETISGYALSTEERIVSKVHELFAD